AFAGYDGTQGDGTAFVNGFRKSIVSPNAVETLDVATKTRTRLNLSNRNTYPVVSWDATTGNIIYSQLSSDADLTGQYMYDFNSSTPRQVEGEGEEDSGYAALSSLGSDMLFVAKYSDTQDFLSNLGETYGPSITVVGLYNETAKKT